MTASTNSAPAADLILAAARIDSEAASRPDDALHEGDKQHAQKLRGRVNSPPPAYMREIGSGGELVPASMLGENTRALDLRDTVGDPNYITVAGMLTLQKLRTGGRQTVVVQHVNVNDGGQALVAGEIGDSGRPLCR